MSKKYKDVMDKITADEDMKKRILFNIENIDEQDCKWERDAELEAKFKYNRFIKNIGMVAACFMVIICSISTNTQFKNFFKFKGADSQPLEISQNDNSSVSDIDSTEAVNSHDTIQDEEIVSEEKEQESELKQEGNKTKSISKELTKQSVSEIKKDQKSNIGKVDNSVVEPSTKDVKNNEPNTKVENNSMEKNTQENEKSLVHSEQKDNIASTTADSYSQGAPTKAIWEHEEFDTIDELKSNVKFQLKIPEKTLKDFKIDRIGVISQQTVSIDYTNDKEDFQFRTSNGTEDISGDYTIYENEKIINLGKESVKLKGNKDAINLAIWTQDNMSYSISSISGLKEDDVLDIIKSIK